METYATRSAQDVRDYFRSRGITVSQWAREHGFPVSTVLQVISGRNAASYGQGHKIAVALGMKSAIIDDRGESHAA